MHRSRSLDPPGGFRGWRTLAHGHVGALLHGRLPL